MQETTLQLRTIKFDHSPPKRKFRMLGVEFDAASTVHMFAAVAAAGAFYVVTIRSGANMERCLLVSAGLVVGMGFYVLRFVRNRPAHYALDWAASLIHPHRTRPRIATRHPYINTQAK